MGDPKYGSLPFAEQIAFFRDKLNLDTATWADIRREAHARAFVVAGARGELLSGFRQAIDQAISDGTTLTQFRKSFDALVTQHGWDYTGSRNWRSAVIYNTNLRTSYAAARYKQLQAVKGTRPYWEFHHTPVHHPRRQHIAWDGITLHADDPWWNVHYPPLGWGCQCVVYARSSEDLARRGKSGPDLAPKDGTYKVPSGPFTGEQMPVGIDPGWDYNVGQAAWGRQLSETEWKATRHGWTPLTAGPLTATNWQTLGRPATIPLDTPTAQLGSPLNDPTAVVSALKQILGGDEKVFDLHGFPTLINADVLGSHIDPQRAEYIPLLMETLEHPYEVWLGFMRQHATGKVALRARIIKAFDLPGSQGITLVLNAQHGVLTGYTFIAPNRMNYLRNQRWGMLLYGRD